MLCVKFFEIFVAAVPAVSLTVQMKLDYTTYSCAVDVKIPVSLAIGEELFL